MALPGGSNHQKNNVHLQNVPIHDGRQQPRGNPVHIQDGGQQPGGNHVHIKEDEWAHNPQVPGGFDMMEAIHKLFRTVQAQTKAQQELIDVLFHSITAQQQQLQQQQQLGVAVPVVGDSLEQFMKLDPPIFKGERDPELAENWVRKIENIFWVTRCPDGDKVRLASHILQFSACVWWDTALRTTFAGRQESSITWAEFANAFRDKYIPAQFKKAKRQEFLNLEQGSMSVTEYEDKFIELEAYAPHICEDEAARAEKFLHGLRGPIRGRLVVMVWHSLAEVYEAACRVEQNLGPYRPRSQGSRAPIEKIQLRVDNKRKRAEGYNPAQSSSSVSRQQCQQCGRFHQSQQCCKVIGGYYGCSQVDHMISECSNLQKQRMTIAPTPVLAPVPARAPAPPQASARATTPQHRQTLVMRQFPAPHPQQQQQQRSAQAKVFAVGRQDLFQATNVAEGEEHYREDFTEETWEEVQELEERAEEV